MDDKEYTEFIKWSNMIPNLDDEQLKDELMEYLIAIKEMEKRLYHHRISYIPIRWLIYTNAISNKYERSAGICALEFSYEYYYLNLFKKIIKHNLKSKDYKDTKIIYLCLGKLNEIGTYRDFYMYNLVKSANKHSDSLPLKASIDYCDISIVANKLVKKIK